MPNPHQATSSLTQLGLRALVAVSLAASALAAKAASVDFTFSGQLLSTAAEQNFPGIWGVDAYGKDIVGLTYTATVHYEIDPSKLRIEPTYSSNDERPGPSSATFTVAGRTYSVNAGTNWDPLGGIQAYYKNGQYINLSVFGDHNADTGVFFQFPYAGGSIDLFQSESGNTSTVPELLTFPAKGTVVIPVTGAGVLRGNYNITSFSVTAVPEPAGWLMLIAGCAVMARVRHQRMPMAKALA